VWGFLATIKKFTEKPEICFTLTMKRLDSTQALQDSIAADAWLEDTCKTKWVVIYWHNLAI
jgi:hypothetical protein